ncbi:MAG TPA: glycine cleavage system protein GcvH [Acidimicrobiia bacterium]|nr:glycine cleavage system protein GcvH [Acidimicrobiia bacterium]
MNYPEGLRFSAEHEWVAVDGVRARVGISDFAQDALGDVVYVELPKVGTMITAHATCAEVESTKSVSDVYAPVSGEVVEVNDALGTTPELLNQDPYGDGWLFVVAMRDPVELDALMDAAAYQRLVETQ